MQAEVISIGDEITSGQRLDTNSQWLSERLGELGVRVMYHTTVADDLEANVRVFGQATERADIVVSTGGLGPTADDLTREALAAMSGTELVLDAEALAHIERLFSRRQRPMPERNRLQALFPAGSRVVPNPEGSAPGIDLTIDRPEHGPARIFALPGVPAEMKQMWEQTVAGAIARFAGVGRVIRHYRIKCFGVGESDLEQMLPDLIRRGRDPQVGITVSGATITLRITAAGPTPEACQAAMQPTICTIQECLGDLIFGTEDDELHDAVDRLLGQRGQTLAVAEIGTGGLIADWFGEIGARGATSLAGAVVIRSTAALRGLLGMASESLETDDTETQRQLVGQMAEQCRQRAGADYGLAVGPFPAADERSATPPEFHYALAGPQGMKTMASPYVGHTSLLKSRSAKQALNLLRLSLIHRSP